MFEVLNKNDRELLKECTVHTARPSGPGGTKADTSESAVEIIHEPTDLTVRASESRSQQKNRKRALRRLRKTYALQIRHDVDPDDIAVPPALREYVDQDLRINPKNEWYPFLVKLILDVFVACDGQVSTTADFLGISTGQLIRFFKNDDQLWKRVNELREEFGHSTLT